MTYKSDLLDVAWLSLLQLLCQLDQPFLVNMSPCFILQPIFEVKRHAHCQFPSCIKYVNIIFEQFWMPCVNGGIALFILIHHTFNRKRPFIWICSNKFNMPHGHQLNVILFKLLWCCRLFYCCTTSPMSLILK